MTLRPTCDDAAITHARSVLAFILTASEGMNIYNNLLAGLAVCLLVAGFGSPARGGNTELDRLAAANTAAVDSIRTIHCKVRVEDKSVRWGVTSGEYWRAGDRIRLEFMAKGNLNQAVIRDGVVRFQMKQDLSGDPGMKAFQSIRDGMDGDRYTWHGAIEKYNGGSQYPFDPWEYALCRLNDHGKAGNVTFADFARNHAKEFHAVRRDAVGSAPTEAVDFRLPGSIGTTHFDPAANYMIRKSGGASDPDDGTVGYTEIINFREYAPGVFFPERAVVKRRNRGKDEADEVFTFTDVSINKPIPDSVFEFKFRRGSHVSDRIQGLKYRVNEDGSPMGETAPLVKAVVAPASVDAPANPSGPRTETREEPPPSGRWVLPLSAAVLASAGLLALWRRRSAARAEA